jgi:murein DD-endopeptidase MepM/ murein hydrolase activator NlpD
MPVKSNYQIISLFFIKKPLSNKEIENKNNDYQVLISHPEVSFSMDSYSYVLATKDGTVKSINRKENWGIEEIEIEIEHDKQFTSKYKGLEKSLVSHGDLVETGQIIAQTGDNRLYPTISFQLLKNGKAVDPFLYIKK